MTAFAPDGAVRGMPQDNSAWHLFTGRYLDYETGLYHYRARHYNPYLGRFLQRDPAGYIDGPNLYEYVRSRPGAFTDPTGKFIPLAAAYFIGAYLIKQTVISVVETVVESQIASLTGDDSFSWGNSFGRNVASNVASGWMPGAAERKLASKAYRLLRAAGGSSGRVTRLGARVAGRALEWALRTAAETAWEMRVNGRSFDDAFMQTSLGNTTGMALGPPAVRLAWAAARLTWATARGAGRAARWMYNHWPIGFDRQHVPTGMGFGGAVNMRWRGFANHAADDTVDGGGTTPRGVTAAEVRATIVPEGEQAVARAGVDAPNPAELHRVSHLPRTTVVPAESAVVPTLKSGTGDRTWKLVEQEGDIVSLQGKGPIAEYRIMGAAELVEDHLYLRGSHIEGPGAGLGGGMAEMILMGKALGRQYGVSRITVQGARRTTGKYKGTIPRPITIEVDRL